MQLFEAFFLTLCAKNNVAQKSFTPQKKPKFKFENFRLSRYKAGEKVKMKSEKKLSWKNHLKYERNSVEIMKNRWRHNGIFFIQNYIIWISWKGRSILNKSNFLKKSKGGHAMERKIQEIIKLVYYLLGGFWTK